jgi:GDPmannose 4,6-dehydratase
LKVAVITGCVGQDGYYLTRQLKDLGVKVIGLSRNEMFIGGKSQNPINITNPEAVDKLIRECKPSQIYHLAAFHHSSENRTEPLPEIINKSLDINVNATNNFLGSILRHVPECRFFYASSSRIFGVSEKAPQTELTSYKPACPYGISKVAGMHVCQIYREQHGVFASCGILYNHDSPRREPQFLLPRIIKDCIKIKNGSLKSLQIGNADTVIDLGFAPEYVTAMRLILDLDSPDDFIIATGEKHTVREIVHQVYDSLGIDTSLPFENQPSRLTNQPSWKPIFGDASKLYKASGWKAKTKLKEIITSIIENTSNNE